MQTNISPSTIEDPDDFFGTGASLETGQADAPGPSILDAPEDEAARILDEAANPEQPAGNNPAKPADTSAGSAALAALDNDLSGTGDDDDATGAGAEAATGRRRTDKSAMVEAAKKLVEDGVLLPFGDELDEEGKVSKKAKALEDYTQADFISLIKDNLAERAEELNKKDRDSLFEALPIQMQHALKYFGDGGTDAVGLFKALGEVEETRALDITKPADQKQIVRQYLQVKKFGSADDIDDQIADYEAAGTLSKWAEKHKPELDKLDQERVQLKLQQQEQAKKDGLERRNSYVKNVYGVLKENKLGDTKIDTARRDKLYVGLTQNNHQLANGRPTNLLGHLLEQTQFGEKANYDLLAQVTWLLEDPSGFHEHFGKAAASKVALDTAAKIKQAQAAKTGSAGADEESETGAGGRATQRTIRRRNILTGELLS